MSGSATTAAISKRASGCRSKSALVFSRPILTHTATAVARLLRTVQASSCKRRVAPWLRRRNLAYEHKRQSGTEHNQERPDKKFQPINRGNIARPQIVPARHGYDPPCPWQFGHNVEPLLWVPSPAEEMLGSLAPRRRDGMPSARSEERCDYLTGWSGLVTSATNSRARAIACHLVDCRRVAATAYPFQVGNSRCHCLSSSRRFITSITTTGR